MKKWTTVYIGAKEYAEFMEKVKRGETPTMRELRIINKLKFNGYRDLILEENEET